MVFKDDSNTNKAAISQKDPKGKGKEIIQLVKKDLDARVEVGIQKYGESLRAFNGRNALLDAYQEALDLVMYLRQTLEEQEHNVEHLTAVLAQLPTVRKMPNISTLQDAERYISTVVLHLYQKQYKGDKHAITVLLAEILSILIEIQKLYGE